MSPPFCERWEYGLCTAHLNCVNLMRMGRKHPPRGAFTRIELLVVLLVLAVLIGVLAPATIQRKRSAQLASCVANLKQVILAELLWVNDDEKMRLSWQIAPNEIGPRWKYLDHGKLFPHLQALSNELATPMILVCPADKRATAKSFADLGDSNLSYFVNLDVYVGGYSGGFLPRDEPRQLTIFGDRNVTNSIGVRGGIVSVTKSNYNSLGWSSKMHNQGNKRSQDLIGNVAYFDGSVETVTATKLQKPFKYDLFGDYTNRLAIP
jgi:prepilin-type processing-associated H-X9-DG protein